MSTAPNSHHQHAAPDIHRTLPHSLEAEQGVLGSMLISPTDVCALVEGLPEDLWYQPAHQTIYGVLIEAWRGGRPMDVITLTQALRESGNLNAIGGPAFITHLFTFTPTAANAGYYLEIVRECYARRRIIGTCTEYAAWAYENTGEVDLLQDALEADILALPRAGSVESAGDDPKARTMEAIEEIEAIYEGRAEVVGIKLGLASLDRMMGGATPGQMIVIAARPSVGKSALALNIAESVAVDRKLPTGIFTLEMTEKQQRRRLLLSRGKVNLQRIREKTIREHDFPNLMRASAQVADAPLYMDDTRGLTISDLRARARRWHHRHGLKLLVVDYLQLLKSNSRQAQGSREREISEVSEGLKSLAGELGIPLIALCQLNRDVERQKRKPRLSDLRESGSLEQDADAVLLLHREEMQAENDEERAEFSGEAELIIAKQREGPIGPIYLTFLKEFTRFEDRALK